MTHLLEIAEKEGFNTIVDGTNADELLGHRPGYEANKQLGIKSPLAECQFTKDDIRKASRDLQLRTWNRPSAPCLSTRLPTGSKITKDKLSIIEQAEMFLKQLGFNEFRVRHHGDIARIELAKHEMEKIFDIEKFDLIDKRFKEIGFQYTALDLGGFYSGKMNK